MVRGKSKCLFQFGNSLVFFIVHLVNSSQDKSYIRIFRIDFDCLFKLFFRFRVFRHSQVGKTQVGISEFITGSQINEFQELLFSIFKLEFFKIGQSESFDSYEIGKFISRFTASIPASSGHNDAEGCQD